MTTQSIRGRWDLPAKHFDASSKPEVAKPVAILGRQREAAGSPANPEGKVSEESVRMRRAHEYGAFKPQVIGTSIHREAETLTPTTGLFASISLPLCIV